MAGVDPRVVVAYIAATVAAGALGAPWPAYVALAAVVLLRAASRGGGRRGGRAAPPALRDAAGGTRDAKYAGLHREVVRCLGVGRVPSGSAYKAAAAALREFVAGGWLRGGRASLAACCGRPRAGSRARVNTLV